MNVLITASPIPTDPDPAVLDVTVASVRHRLPGARITVGFDGCPPALPTARQAAYRDHMRSWSETASAVWGAEVHTSDRWVHQSGTLRAMLDATDDPAVLVVEHDTPLVGATDLAACETAVLSNALDHVRLHHSERIYTEHQHLMYDTEPVTVGGLPVLRTRQWSQRPHVARTRWYEALLDRLIGARHGHVEDIVYHPVARLGWPTYRLAVYAADGPADLMRSWHTDGRGADPKTVEIP